MLRRKGMKSVQKGILRDLLNNNSHDIQLFLKFIRK